MPRNGVDISELRDFVQNVNEKLGADGAREFIESCAKELAARLLTKTIRRTPVGDYNAYQTDKDGNRILDSNDKPIKHNVDRHGKKKTVKQGGTLRRGWTAEKRYNKVEDYVDTLRVTRTGDVYTIEIVNPVEYAPYVEFGHRTVNGGWVEGKFMMTISANEVQAAAPEILEQKLIKRLGEIFK